MNLNKFKKQDSVFKAFSANVWFNVIVLSSME